jgi:Protein of unknown function (DUF4236)
MAWRFRKSKIFGPVRLTLGRRGVSSSIGWGPLRFSRGADGRLRRTLRVPGTGLSDTVGGRRGSRPDQLIFVHNCGHDPAVRTLDA